MLMVGNESDGSEVSDGSDNRSDELHDDEDEGDGEGAEGGDDSSEDNDMDTDEARPYDISIAASHSYLGPGLVSVGGRSVLEPGWRGSVPVLAHHGVVFPGETVPMLLPHAADAAMLAQAIRNDKLFGLLCPDDSGVMMSGYGVLCEVLMAGIGQGQEVPTSITFKARAIHRFRLLRVPKVSAPMHSYSRMRSAEVEVLAEMSARDTLRAARLESLDPRRERRHLKPAQQVLRRMDAAATPWPLFVYDIFDFHRLRRKIKDYFKTLMLAERLPDEPVSLSFWVASNLALATRDRLALFVVDNALLRLHMECKLINKKSVLCCSSCMTKIASREHIFAMSSEGVHANYTNLGGYMHDILTVSQTTNVETTGAPSSEYSWFPGYHWTVALCSACMAHVGWRFQASERNLRPKRFFGLCRNYVTPRPPDSERPELE